MQDADVVWLRDPIKEFFHNPGVSGDFDAYFMDDGARSPRFSPYFSNTGFYYLRNNPRTQYFIQSFLYNADTILEWRSHQSALTQLLADHSSTFGLKVKTLAYVDFPSGKVRLCGCWEYLLRVSPPRPRGLCGGFTLSVALSGITLPR